MKPVQGISLKALFVIVSLFAVGVWGCETSRYDLGQTGNTGLRTLGFENMNLIQPVTPVAYSPFYSNFHSQVSNYSIIQSTNTRFKIVVAPNLVWTKFFVNGVKVKMETNSIGYPTYTDVTHLLRLSAASNSYTVKTQAEDGSTLQYVINILGIENDASISDIMLSSGSVYPKFDDGRAPYFADGSNGTNCYYAVMGDNFFVTVKTVDPNAAVRIGGTNATANVAHQVIMDPAWKTGDWHDYKIEVTSANAAFKNTKLLRLAFIPAVADSRLTGIVVNDGAQSLSTSFYFGTTNYAVVFEDVTTMKLQLTKAEAAATVEVDNGDGNWVAYGSAVSKDVVVTGLPVTMSGEVKIRVTSPNGAKSRIYVLRTMLFTRTNYDFDGGIKTFIDSVKLNGEYAPEMDVEGVLTVRDYYGYNDAYYCFFVQDKNTGLYIFLSLMGDPNRVLSQFKVGHRVKFKITKAKNYYGQMEGVEIGKNSMTFVDGTTSGVGQKTQPVYAIPMTGFYNNSHQGKIMRVEQKVGTDINAKNVGYFENESPFHINNPALLNRIRPKLQVGMGGVFFGPCLYGWYINQLEFVNEDYCIFK